MNGIRFGEVETSLRPEKIIIVASGKSLAKFDLSKLRGCGYIIAVNGAGEHVPFADAWFTLDPWGLHLTGDKSQLPKQFGGRLFAAVPADYGTAHARSPQHRKAPSPSLNITYLHRLVSHNLTNVSSDTAYKLGLSEDRSCIHTGNSGYGALNLAYHMRPKKILLLGIDGSVGYFYKSDTPNRPLASLKLLFQSAKFQLDKAEIQLINGSPESIVKNWTRYSPEKALEQFNG